MEQNIQQDRINELMDCFSFSKAERILRLLDVQFSLPDGRTQAPDEPYLRFATRRSINEVCNAPIPEGKEEMWNLNMKNGPFHIKRWGGIKNNGEKFEELSLSFIPEFYSTEKPQQNS
jgi:hypothetical protein